MNYARVFKNLGVLVLLVAACMATSLIWTFLDYQPEGDHRDVVAFVIAITTSFILGIALIYFSRRAEGELFRKEALAIVGLGWLLFGLLGSLPFIFSGVLSDQGLGGWGLFTTALFESVSGFTTTGASIFAEPENLPRSILYWRSLTHWLGAMGVIVLFVAILGGTGTAGKQLVSSESTSLLPETATPRIRQTALLLWKIYLALSVACFVLLKVQGMNTLDALCHTFGAVGTAGFSTKSASIGHYDRFAIEFTIIVFMVLGSINFHLYAVTMKSSWTALLKNQECRIFLCLLLVATLVIAGDLWSHETTDYSAGKSFRLAFFQVAAINTTTGFSTFDFDTWPSLSKWMLVLLMFVGGCAGSTAGGLKVIRVFLFLRVALQEVERTFRPSVVRPLRINQQSLDPDIQRTVTGYVGFILFLCILSPIVLLALQNKLPVESQVELDLNSAFLAVVATLNNIGPGLGQVGPTENYAFFSAPAKLFLCLLMILGRLEVMVLLSLFLPGFWRRQ
jgi:trk system potassium uptake protein TrkH